MEKIEITRDENDGMWTIRQGNKYSDKMGYDEMLGLLVALTTNFHKRSCLAWMKTEKEHNIKF